MSTTLVRVSEIDGRAEVQAIDVGPYPPEIGAAQAIDALFDRALGAIDREGDEVTIEYDGTYGYVSRLEQVSPDVADGAARVEVTEFTTPADRTGAARARDALDDLLQRWRSPEAPAWAYTWSRFAAADTPATATTVRVVHEDDRTTLAASDGGPGDVAPPAEATIRGTVESAVGVLAAGGWVDVALDPDSLDALIAVDPSPSAAGDGYWIRIDYTDLSVERARAALAAARERWAAADVDAYRYRMTFDGADARWAWTVTMDAGTGRVKPGRGAPDVEEAFVGPGVEQLFDLIEGLVAEGARVAVRYDRELGTPIEIDIRSASGRVPKGTITLSRFKEQ
jgi:hypothetical protein